jgi:hypothetical protein
MRLLTNSLLLIASAILAGCRRQPRTAPAVDVATAASFVARSPNNAATPPRNECWLAGEMHGTAFLRARELELVIPRGWVAVTRDNDKEWDDLHLVVEVSAHPPGPQAWAPLGESAPIVLRPTVDSAGPQLTTWETADTLRLLVAWKPSLAPRWLFFHLNYQTLSHAGRRSTCGGTLATDTLRFKTGE